MLIAECTVIQPWFNILENSEPNHGRYHINRVKLIKSTSDQTTDATDPNDYKAQRFSLLMMKK